MKSLLPTLFITNSSSINISSVGSITRRMVWEVALICIVVIVVVLVGREEGGGDEEKEEEV